MTPASNTSQKTLDLWLGKAVPRYTSYPPAPAFHEGVGVSDYIQSLEKLPTSEPTSLYLHIPFCRELCLYCGCNTTITKREDRVRSYLGFLKQELRMVADLSTAPRRISHLHFGGGTPNIISDRDIHDLFDHLHRYYNFSDCRELATELDPRTMTHDQVKALAACGISRVSLGVQDFAPEVQAIVHRLQPYEMVARACDWLRSSGITDINFDLMYGLPKQTSASVAETARLVCSLRPSRIALFSYAHVPQMKRHQQALIPHGIPGNHERLDMDQAARDVLLASGYVEIGMDHFAHPDDPMTLASRTGRLHRNFQGYTDDATPSLLAFGASSISETRDGYFQNERDENIYQDIIGGGQLTIKRGILKSREDNLRAAVIEQLMCYLACDVAALCRIHGFPEDSLDTEIATLNIYEEAGILARQSRNLQLTSPYRMAIRVICRAFDNHTPATPASSSRAA